MSVADAGKLLLIAATVLAVVGVALLLAGRLGFHGLPGDMSFRTGSVSFAFPLVTCLVISVALTVLINIVLSLRR